MFENQAISEKLITHVVSLLILHVQSKCIIFPLFREFSQRRIVNYFKDIRRHWVLLTELIVGRAGSTPTVPR